MNTITRRQALRASVFGASVLGGFMLTACSTASVTPAQLIADAQGILAELFTPPASGAIPGIAGIFPGKIPAATLASIEQGIVTGEAALAKLGVAPPAPAGANTLQTVEGYINDALDVVGSLGLVIPPPYGEIITAITVLLPGIEAFVNGLIPAAASTKAATRLKLTAPTMTPAQARARLGIPAA